MFDLLTLTVKKDDYKIKVFGSSNHSLFLVLIEGHLTHLLPIDRMGCSTLSRMPGPVELRALLAYELGDCPQLCRFACSSGIQNMVLSPHASSGYVCSNSFFR